MKCNIWRDICQFEVSSAEGACRDDLLPDPVQVCVPDGCPNGLNPFDAGLTPLAESKTIKSVQS